MNQLKIQSSITNRVEVCTRTVSLQDKSFLKISAQNDCSKWEAVSNVEEGLKLRIAPMTNTGLHDQCTNH